jgi:hypothetical protein
MSEKKQKRSFLKAFFVRLAVKCAVFMVIVFAAFFLFKHFGSEVFGVKTERNGALVASQLEKCQELVSVKNHYSDIVIIKKSRIAGFAKAFTIVKFYGVIRAGVGNLGEAEYEVSADGNSVRVHLPPCEVLGNEISGIEVFDESRSIFVSVSLSELADEIQVNKELSEQNLVNEGLLLEAEEHARQIVENTLYALGFSSVVVEF